MMEKEEKKSVRAGNFKIVLGESGVTVSDLMDGVSHTVPDDIAKGVFLRLMADGDYGEWLGVYGAVMHMVISAVPDFEFLNDLQEAAQRCVERHIDLYGIDPEINKSDDDLILREQEQIQEELKTVSETLLS